MVIIALMTGMVRMEQVGVAGFEQKLAKVMELDTNTKVEVLTAWRQELELALLHDSEDTELLETVERLLRVETLKRDAEHVVTRRLELT